MRIILPWASGNITVSSAQTAWPLPRSRTATATDRNKAFMTFPLQLCAPTPGILRRLVRPMRSIKAASLRCRDVLHGRGGESDASENGKWRQRRRASAVSLSGPQRGILLEFGQNVGDFAGRNWLAVEIPLNLDATLEIEAAHLLFGLDAFGGRRHSK